MLKYIKILFLPFWLFCLYSILESQIDKDLMGNVTFFFPNAELSTLFEVKPSFCPSIFFTRELTSSKGNQLHLHIALSLIELFSLC